MAHEERASPVGLSSSTSSRGKIDEELEFFTELALHETERWIQAVTKKKFQNPDDPRKSLENGVLFCELLNAIKPGSIRKINKLPTPIAGLDNLQVFLEACQAQLGLRQSQLFDLHDLEDLSTRAIAEDEELLRAEYDRRLRNVALTVYWLGKTAKKSWDGPQLDFSSFADLVNRTGVASPRNSSFLDDSIGEEEDILKIHRRQFSEDSGDKSSAYGSLPSKTSGEEEDLGTQHTRENSIESLISCEGSSDKTQSADMPGRFPEQGWGRGAGRYSAVQEALFDNDDRDYPEYQDEGSLSRDDYDRFRFNDYAHSSSGDSGDPYSNHSRQSSTLSSSSRGDFVPRTRVTERRTAQPAVNPLQFVAVKPKEDLTQKAKETIEMMEKQKKDKTKIQLEEEDWQSNLMSWKSKMRRKSSGYELSNEEPELTLDESTKAKVKSFKQMVETNPESKKRGFNIYPYGEEEESDQIFSSSSRHSASSGSTPVREDSEPERNNETYSSVSSRYETEGAEELYAPRNETSDYKSGYKQDYEQDFKPDYKSNYKSETRVTKSDSYGQSLNNGDHNSSQRSYSSTVESEYKPRSSDVASRYAPENRISPEKEKPRSSPDKLLKDPPKKLKERWPLDGNTSGSVPWQRKSLDNNSDRSSQSPAREEREGSEDRGQRISLKERMERLHGSQSTEMTKTELEVTPNKLSSLRSAFERQDNQSDGFNRPTAAPKKVIRNVEDIPSFKENLEAQRELLDSSFEQQERDFENLQSRNVKEVKQMYDDYNSANVMDYPQPRSKRDTGAYQSYNPPEPSRNDVSSYTERSTRDDAYKSYDRPESFRNNELPSYADNLPSKDGYHGYASVDDGYRAKSSKEDYLSDSSGNQSSNYERKNYVEKSIKIKIPPASAKGFGFTIKGGKETSAPIVVDKVRIGTAADVCELLAGDEIVQINGAEVSKHYKESVELVIDNAVKVGLVDLKVRRYLTQADIFDDDEYGTVQRRPEPVREDETFKKQTEAPPSVDEEEDEDQPPALPSQPPPAPNWSTFPGAAPPQPATDLSFLDSTDLASDPQLEPPSEPKIILFCGIEEGDLDEATRTKISMLKRRSDFLGVNLEDMEEYRKLQEDFVKEKEEEEERRRKEEAERERQKEEERERQKKWNTPATSVGNSFSSIHVLEQQEKEIIETLEQEEAKRRNTHLDSIRDSVPKSRSNDEIEKRAMQDMESTVRDHHQPAQRGGQPVRSGRSFFNMEEEQRRMQQWAEEQERMRQLEEDDDPYFAYRTNNVQERYSKEQAEMRQKFMADMKRSEEVEAQKKEQEAKLLEKELAHQRELEMLAIQQQEERERRKREAEEERKREQLERKRQEQVNKRLLEEQQIKEEIELKNRLALRAQEIELNQDATTTIQQLYPWRVGAMERRSAERELEKRKQGTGNLLSF